MNLLRPHAMLAHLLARTSYLRRTYARLRFVGLICFLTVLTASVSILVLAPSFAPPLLWSLVLLYLLRKAWLALRTHHAVSQLGWERQFLGYTQAAPDLLAPLCLHRPIQLRSLVAARLAKLANPVAATSLRDTEPRVLIRRLPRPHFGIDVALLGLAVVLSLSAGRALPTGSAAAHFLFVGAAMIVCSAEMYRLWLLQRLRTTLPSYGASLAAWLREATNAQHRPNTARYRHTPLYRAPARVHQLGNTSQKAA